MQENYFFLNKQRNDRHIHPDFTPQLELVTQTQNKKPSKVKILQSYTQTFIERADALRQDIGSVIYFDITITYPLDKNLNESWFPFLETQVENK